MPSLNVARGGYSLGTKLRFLFLGFCLFIGAAGLTISLSLGHLVDSARYTADTLQPLSEAAFEMEINVIGATLGVMKYLVRADPADRAQFEEDRAEVQLYLGQFRSLARSEREHALADQVAELSGRLATTGFDLMADKDRSMAAVAALTRMLSETERVLDGIHNQVFVVAGAPGGTSRPDEITRRDDQTEIFDAWIAFRQGAMEVIGVPFVAADSDGNRISAETSDKLDELRRLQAELSRVAARLEPYQPNASPIIALTDAVVAQASAFAGDQASIAFGVAELIGLRTALDDILDEEIQIPHQQSLDAGFAQSRSAGQRVTLILLSVGALLIVSFVALSAGVAQAVVRPIQSLARYAEAIGEGDYDCEVAAPKGSEFAFLAAKLKNMARQLKTTHHDLGNANERLAIQVTERTANLAAINADLVLARDQAQAANMAKTTFLANMSHELRTPLNAVIGFSDLMTGEAFGPIGNERYRGYLTDISQSGKHLLQIVNDILDISRIEINGMELSETDIDPAELIDQTARLIAPRAEERGIELIADNAQALPNIRADATRVKQILINIAYNAIKFTPRGGTVQLGAERTVQGELALSVRDTGIGMTTEQVETALSLFGQVDKGHARAAEGVGLGLPLAERLIELHGGAMRIESVPGAGTCVTVTFPASRVCGLELPAVQAASGMSAA